MRVCVDAGAGLRRRWVGTTADLISKISNEHYQTDCTVCPLIGHYWSLIVHPHLEREVRLVYWTFIFIISGEYKYFWKRCIHMLELQCKHFWKGCATIFENDVQIKSGEARGGPQTLDQVSRKKWCGRSCCFFFLDLFFSPKKKYWISLKKQFIPWTLWKTGPVQAGSPKSNKQN